MAEPIIVQKVPYELELDTGTYWWCSCGKSKKELFCDGSHKGTEFKPVSFEVKEKQKVWLCGCKHTANKPFCDGAHKSLK